MWARLSTFEGPSGLSDEQIKELTRETEEKVVSAAREMEGFKGVIALLDRPTGKSLTVTFWESEEALRASEDAAGRLREDAAQISGEKVAGVDRYEVTFLEPPTT